MANLELLEDIVTDGDLEYEMLMRADAAGRASGDGPADLEGEVFDDGE